VLCCKVGVVVVIVVVTLEEQMLRVLNVKYLVWVFRGAENITVLAEVLLKAACFLSVLG